MHWNAKSCAVFVDLRGFLHYKMAYVIKYVIKMGHNFPVLQLDAQFKNYSKMVDYSDDAIFPISLIIPQQSNIGLSWIY